jgi:hypothetical protein
MFSRTKINHITPTPHELGHRMAQREHRVPIAAAVDSRA